MKTLYQMCWEIKRRKREQEWATRVRSGWTVYWDTPCEEAGYDQKEDTKEWGNNREGIDTAHKLTGFHIRDSGDVPRMERLIKCICFEEHCVSAELENQEKKKRTKNMGNESEIRMDDIGAPFLRQIYNQKRTRRVEEQKRRNRHCCAQTHWDSYPWQRRPATNGEAD